MKRKIKLRTQSSFTLAEVLAAITLFAVMSVGIASLMRETTRVSGRVESRQFSVLAGQLAMERLSRELSQTFRERLQREETRFVARDSGQGWDLVFSYLDSPMRSLFERRSPGVKLVHYFLEPSPRGTFRLMRAEVPINLEAQLELQTAQVVAEGLLELELSFYDPRNDQWIEDWDSNGPYTGGYFPQAVRISLVMVDPQLPREDWDSRSLRFQTSSLLLNEIEEHRR
ncbi:MAG: hypothetical protein EA369_02690 [Bradymonadales bacterium]|nr:MAG: hypothetical protein EA369_02690 [Bradymonadales bacterium]